MSIQILCASCRTRFAVSDSLAGAKIRCRECDRALIVPDEEDEDRPRRRAAPDVRKSSASNSLPWIIGGVVCCVALLTVGGVVVALLLRPVAPPPAPVVANQTQPMIMPQQALQPVIQQAAPPQQAPVQPGAELSRDAMSAVKAATVNLRVTIGPGEACSGTGFFGVPDSPNIVLTNAHVVGMLAPNSRKPARIEVIINSGERNEKVTTATVAGVDRLSDLAVLELVPIEGLPKPLTVKTPDDLRELDKVYIFGFPLGEQLGREITIRPSSVSSLRKQGGMLHRIQVAGGMDPGNSGGPVVDAHGDVIGVAVSGIPGRMINFAIPGDRVHIILTGRIAAMGIGQPFKSGTRVGVPVTIEMIDPRHRVAEVAVDVWAGDAPTNAQPNNRPPMSTQPGLLPGDRDRQRVLLPYNAGIGQGEVVLPELTPGKVYWVQPSWKFNNGETRWAGGHVHQLTASPLERKPVLLQARYQGASRRVELLAINRLKVGASADEEFATLKHQTVLQETPSALPDGGTRLQITYQGAKVTVAVCDSPSESPLLQAVRPHLRLLTATVDLDSTGAVKRNDAVFARTAKPTKEMTESLLQFHEPVKNAMRSVMLPLPGRMVNALETWTFSQPVVVNTVFGSLDGTVEMKGCYLGVRAIEEREEAVIKLEGQLRDSPMAGRINGLVLMDLSNGLIRQVDVDAEYDLPGRMVTVEGKRERMRFLAIETLRLKRAP